MILFIIPVLISANYGGWKSGIIATMLSALCIIYFPLPKNFFHNATRTSDLFQWNILWLSGVFISLAVRTSHERQRLLKKMNQELLICKKILLMAPNAIINTDPSGTIIQINPKTETLFGYTSNELVGNKIETIIPEEVLKENKILAQDVQPPPKANDTLIEDVIKVKNKSGSELPIHISFTPIKSDHSSIISIIATDMTKQLKSEAALREKEKFSNQLLDVSPVIIAIYDLVKQKTIFVSHHVKNILGYSEIEITNYDSIAQKLAHPEDMQNLIRHRNKLITLKDGELLDVSFRWKRKDETWCHLLTRTAVFQRNTNRDVTQVISATIDITAEKKLQLQLEQSNQALEQFAEIAAHDLRSPLRSILGWSQMLESLVPEPRNKELCQAIKFIQKNTTKASDLIDDLLKMARVNITATQIESINLTKLIEELMQTLKEECSRKNAKVTWSTLPEIKANSSCMQSLFSNLIRNAITYTDKSRTPEVHIGFSDENEFYKFFISDNGIGIKKEDTCHIFEMFKRLHGDKEYPGTGIGLALCKKIVELYGGKIWVDSTPEKGSIFYFTVPKNWGKGSY